MKKDTVVSVKKPEVVIEDPLMEVFAKVLGDVDTSFGSRS